MRIECPKQYLSILGKTVLMHVLDTLTSSKAVTHTFIVVSNGDGYIDDALANAQHLDGKITIVRNGGDTRHLSVRNGLKAMREHVDDSDWVMVHDAARPGLTLALIDKLVTALNGDTVGGLLAVPIVDTLKRADGAGRVQATIPRERVWAAQTPQMFRYALLCRALEHAGQVTDEASAIESLGLHPKLVEGSPRNFKITKVEDISLAKYYLEGNS